MEVTRFIITEALKSQNVNFHCILLCRQVPKASPYQGKGIRFHISVGRITKNLRVFNLIHLLF